MSDDKLAALKEVLRYEPETGLFYWTKDVACNVKAGAVAGSLSSWGYTQIQFDRNVYRAHRLAWYFFYGSEPKGLIDHINGDRRDNRIANLRAADHRTNCENRRTAQKNNPTGALGVIARNGKFYAQIGVNGKRLHLGVFSTKESAAAAYVEAKRIHHKGCAI